MRSERIIAGITNTRTGDQSPSTRIISNPVHSDFKPWLNKKRKLVHVYISFKDVGGSFTGRLISAGMRGTMNVRVFDKYTNDMSYIRFRAEDVSEIDITADFAPTIYLRTR